MYPDPDIHQCLLFDGILEDLSLSILVPGFPDRMGLDPVPYGGQENVSWIMKEKERYVDSTM